ncbi:hypothetical protein A0J48_008350 [Sphaerospermopsis aphanizomenoides BCCUSP55]|uniref:hypothetical protein n=1 Tax=Sphaerospermopsis aphanizomenoides TaxID=459663 RepID=UPI001907F1FD|nr:hypothetical protein [Sphaerospermopsis aphanizomenoides]MBK1987546.1 hypothetical protein [Sphaerospermopsis aphanizomenoides BCCUSP55]
MQGMMAIVGPAIFDSYRFITIILFAAIYPFHVYSNLIQRCNHPLLICTVVAILPIIIDLSLNSDLVKFQVLLTSLFGIAIIWGLYIIGLCSKPPIKLLKNINYYHTLAKQKFPATYQRNFVQLIVLSGLANLLFLVHAYLINPRVETFALFKPNFERVINLIKDNKIDRSLPCEYGYFSNHENNNVNISRKNSDLVVRFPIFNIGFGDGLVVIVYRSNKVDCEHEKRENKCEGFQPLADSWYWEVY